MDAIQLRPINALFSQGIAAILAFGVPTFTVLYLLAIPAGSWPIVLAATIIVALGLVYAIISHHRVGVWVSSDSIAERGFFGHREEVAVADIGEIVVATVYLPGGSETAPQLFVCDHDGRQLVRMRGQFWSKASMDTVCATLRTRVTVIEHARTLRELHETHPGLLYWFERRRALAATLFTAALALGGLGLYALLYSLGETR